MVYLCFCIAGFVYASQLASDYLDASIDAMLDWRTPEL